MNGPWIVHFIYCEDCMYNVSLWLSSDGRFYWKKDNRIIDKRKASKLVKEEMIRRDTRE